MGIEQLAAHLRGEHSSDRVPGCTACEALPPVSEPEPVAPRVDRPPPARAPTGRLCGCGCGSPVKRRYLPGHDAKHKSRLVKAARSGSAAAKQELEEHGWIKFL